MSRSLCLALHDGVDNTSSFVLACKGDGKKDWQKAGRCCCDSTVCKSFVPGNLHCTQGAGLHEAWYSGGAAAGAQGLLLAKGPGVMAGYYNDEASTAKAFRAGDGWFDTGDLGWRAPSARPPPHPACFCMHAII